MTTVASRPLGRARIISLRVASLAFIGIVLVGSNVVLLFPLFGGLPEATLRDQLEMEPDVLVEMVHGVAIGLTHVTLMLGMLVQLRRPERGIAPLWMCAYIILAMIVYDASQGHRGQSDLVGRVRARRRGRCPAPTTGRPDHRCRPTRVGARHRRGDPSGHLRLEPAAPPVRPGGRGGSRRTQPLRDDGRHRRNDHCGCRAGVNRSPRSATGGDG